MWSESTPPAAAATKKCFNSSLSGVASKKAEEQCEELPTPPVQTPVSIPFQWEEAPGKPRDNNSSSTKPKPKAVRSLHLPPAKKISNDSPSPTMILEGAESSGKGVTHTLSFSFGKLSFRSPEGGAGGNSKRQIGKEGSHRWNLSSWRWGGSFRINNEVADSGNIDFSDQLQPTSPFQLPNPNHQNHQKKKKRFSKNKKSGSFFNSDHSHHPNKSNFLANIYKSFKQAVPWRRKQEGSNKQMA